MLYTNAKDLYKSSFPKSRFKGSSLPQYNYGGSPNRTFLEKGNAFLSSNTGAGISAGAGIAGELISQYGGDGAFAAGASGALKGASAGAQFGLIGAGVGALGGAAYGVFMQQQQAKKEEEAKEQKRQEDLAMNYEASKAILSTYPTEGVADAGFLAAYGGTIKMDKGGVVRPKGDPYEYKYENGKFLTRKKGSKNWITAKGAAEKAIKERIFKMPESTPAPETNLDLPPVTDPRMQNQTPSDGTNVPVNIQPVPTQPVSTTIVRPTPGGFDMSLLSNNTLPSAENVNFRPQGSVQQGYVPKTAEELANINPNSLDPRLQQSVNPIDNTSIPGPIDHLAKQEKSPETPVVSGLATKAIRNIIPSVVPFAGRQFIASTITRDSKFGMDDVNEGIKNHLISSVIKARERTGKNKGGTKYIDYGKDIANDLQSLDVETLDALIGSYNADDLRAATTFGRVSYEYDPKTKEYKVYDNYDFSKIKKEKSKDDDLYTKIRRKAGEIGIGDKNSKRRLIGTFKEEDYKDLKVENEYGNAKKIAADLKENYPILNRIPMFNVGGPTNPPQGFDMSMLANNPIKNFQPTPQETIGGNNPVSYMDVVRGGVKGLQQIFSPENLAQAKQEAKDFKTNVIDYTIENPLDATQIALGTTAIAAGQIPGPIPQLIGSGADVINGGISFGRSAYYANKGDAAKAGLYAGFGAVDMTAGVPGVAGDMASIAKMKQLYNMSKPVRNVVHDVQHYAHEVSPLITGYKTQGAMTDIGSEALKQGAELASNNKSSPTTSPTFPVTMNTTFMNPADTSWVTGQQYSYKPSQMGAGGKIPTASADYLAEGGEVIQHAVNDRPDTDQNGGIKQLNSNTSLFQGDSHNAPSQGIGVANDQEARIYSKRLYAPKDLVAKLKSL